MTLAMAAQDDSIFYEGTINADSERGQRWLSMRVGDYVATASELLKLLEGVGIPTDQVDEHHKALAKRLITQINRESRNAFEQAALTAMVGTSLLATFEAQIDFIELQMDVLDAEGGESSDN